jgi:hypothetical protein
LLDVVIEFFARFQSLSSLSAINVLHGYGGFIFVISFKVLTTEGRKEGSLDFLPREDAIVCTVHVADFRTAIITKLKGPTVSIAV